MSQKQSGRDQQTAAILGAAVEVHKSLGHGFLEAVYQHALAVEFKALAIPFCCQYPMPVFYKETRLDCGYRADFLCYGAVIVEMKAQAALGAADEAQLINYLRASRVDRGLLLNFGRPTLEIKRMILTADWRAPNGVP